MTEPGPRPTDIPPAPPHEPRGSRSWALAGVLSLVLIAAWAVFLLVAPQPVVVPPPAKVAVPVYVPPPSDQVRILAWRNAIDPDVLAAFTADSGVKVVVDGYDTNEQLATLADSGSIIHDVALVSGVGFGVLAAKDLLQPIPQGALTNARNIDPAFTTRAGLYDPGNTRSIVLLWGTIGLAYNAAEVTRRLGEGEALDTWSILFDPEKAAKLADCGIQVIDSPTGVFPIALTYLGLPADSAKVEDTEAATRLWENIRPSIAKFSSQDVVDNLAAGKVCLTLATSGDAYQARGKARIAGLASDIRYALPREGTVVWYDLLAMPKSASNSVNALRFIDYLLRPEVAARMTNAKGFANTVAGAELYVKPEIKTDTALLPDLAKLPKVVEEMTPAPAAVALRNRFWQLINAAPATPQ